MDKSYRFRKLLETARTIIFDFDGVVADSEPYHFKAYSEVFARHGHEVDETEYYKYWTSLGRGARGEIERHGLQLDPIQIRDEKRPIYSRYCRDGTIKVFPETAEFAHRMHAEGKQMAIASGSLSHDIMAILENAGMDDLFDPVIGIDTISTPKPAPDILFAVLDRTSREPYECVVIEDAEKGMYAAIDASIPVIIVRTKETQGIDFSLADVILDSHTELRELLHISFPAR